MDRLKTINIIGCGKVGRTLGRLWTQRRVFAVQHILNRSLASGLRAAEVVGAGKAVERYEQLGPADLVMISTSDAAIEPCCERLCDAGVLRPATVVFHCSGALSCAALDPAKQQRAAVASVHPVKSFADPLAAVETFPGTYCALEGDPEACEALRDALERCGAVTFDVDGRLKVIYHAATVMVCNYLVALAEVGLRCFERAGVSREVAMQAIQPIVRETAANVFRLGPVGALTGPIARGEAAVVASQCEALGACDEQVQQVYKVLGRVAVELSAAQGHADAAALAAIARTLRS